VGQFVFAQERHVHEAWIGRVENGTIFTPTGSENKREKENCIFMSFTKSSFEVLLEKWEAIFR
jgi:hypothetical protein